MGGSSSSLQKCLESAVGGNEDLIAIMGAPFFQISHVKPYNLGISVTPAAVTYPESTEHISEILKCAVKNSLKVQPRCGGHSYANYGL
jgi:FAD/FMN-containing dehydrogenase